MSIIFYYWRHNHYAKWYFLFYKFLYKKTKEDRGE